MRDMVIIQKPWWAALLLAIIAFAVPTVVQAAGGDLKDESDESAPGRRTLWEIE